jgi:hypothetical protein
VKVMELLEGKLTGSSAFVTRELGAEGRLVWCLFGSLPTEG